MTQSISRQGEQGQKLPWTKKLVSGQKNFLFAPPQVLGGARILIFVPQVFGEAHGE